jgi:hypothetical protein
VRTPLDVELRGLTIGFVTALIAYCIDVSESTFFDWKEGFCTSMAFS